MTEHHAIESLMVFEGIERFKTEPISVELKNSGHIISRARNA